MTKLDFSNHSEAQDMIKIIEKDKGLLSADAISFAINLENYHKIIEAGWASIALSLWGHDDPEREWNEMEAPCFEVSLNSESLDLLNKLVKKEKIDIETAVSYFLIFTMDSLGYHI